MYKGEINGIENIADKLLVASNDYGINSLKTTCENILTKQISLDTAIKLFVLAENSEAPLLIKVAVEFIKNNTEHLMKGTSAITFIKENPEMAYKFMCSIWNKYVALSSASNI